MEIHKIEIGFTPPSVSSNHWAIVDGNNGNLFCGKNENDRREIASLIKIINMATSINLLEKYKIDSHKILVKISKFASKICGTKANLEEGDELYLWDLFFAMMLPSGNDAAESIAEYFGTLIYENEYSRFNDQNSNESLKESVFLSPVQYFIKEMNYLCNKLGLDNTHIINCHGLPNNKNQSSAYDIARISSFIMKDSIFQEIVQTKTYECIIKTKRNENKNVKWINTNKLLNYGYNGIKTGNTQNAGPCIVGSIKIMEYNFIIVALGSKSEERRWIDIKKLTTWILKKMAPTPKGLIRGKSQSQKIIVTKK